MPRWSLPTASSLFPSPVPSACPLRLPAPAPSLAPEFRLPFCSLGDFRLPRTASPSILLAPLSIPTAPTAVRAPPAPLICSSRVTAASLAMVNRRPTAVSPLPLPSPAWRAHGAAASPLLLTVPLRRRCFRLSPPLTVRLLPSCRMRIDAAPLSLLLALAARAELAHTPSPEAPLPLRRAGPLLLPLAARIRRLPCSMAHLWPAQLLPSGALRAPPFLVGIVSTTRSRRRGL
ncbi:unnamed protein product [Closterium sp. NIES-65]|nr:unnamed protein product [Closterium sp. NIES-65]